MEPNLIWKNIAKIGGMVGKWKSVSHDVLVKQIDMLSDEGGSGEFARTIYPMIQDPETKARVNETLLNIAKEYSINPQKMEFGMRLLDVCTDLKLPGTKEVILEIIKSINLENLKNTRDPLFFLNFSIQRLKIREATDFLCQELDAFLQIPEAERKRYPYFLYALWALKEIDSGIAKTYENKIGVPPASTPMSEWGSLNDEALEKEIKDILWGDYEWGKSSVSFVRQIKNDELRGRIDRIILALMDDIQFGRYAMSIAPDILEPERFRSKVLAIVKTSQALFQKIDLSKRVEDCMNEFMYIIELNTAIGKLRIIEAEDFLLKQLTPLKKPAPPPLTKEYYFYYGCARSALKALKEISPESVEEHKVE
jgi:hypothetical protein